MDDAQLGRVLGFAGIRRCVGNLHRAIDFYCRALGFEVESTDASTAIGTSVLKLGAESIRLIETSRPLPADPERYTRGSIDTGFQHIAIVAFDMPAALERLGRFAPTPISRGGAVRLPTSAGGVTAFKFLDPDGHPLELICFPPGGGDPRWQCSAEQGATLGIDHSALVVRSVHESIAFYRDRLGFRLATRQVNSGPTQERLDGIAEVVVEVVSLTPTGTPTPHLELLGYSSPIPRPSARNERADRLVWWVDSVDAIADRLSSATNFASLSVVDAGDGVRETVLRDPDGHRHLLLAGR